MSKLFFLKNLQKYWKIVKASPITFLIWILKKKSSQKNTNENGRDFFGKAIFFVLIASR